MGKFIGGPYDGLVANVPQEPEPFTHRVHSEGVTNVHTYNFQDGDYYYAGVTQEADTHTAIDGEGIPEGYVPSS